MYSIAQQILMYIWPDVKATFLGILLFRDKRIVIGYNGYRAQSVIYKLQIEITRSMLFRYIVSIMLVVG